MNRDEVAYENYTQDITETIGGLTYSTLLTGPDTGDISAITNTGSGTSVDLNSIELARVSFYLMATNTNNEETYGLLQFVGDTPLGGGYLDLTSGGLPAPGDDVTLFENNTGSLKAVLDSTGTLTLTAGSSGLELIAVMELADGSTLLFDTISDSEAADLIAANGSSVFSAEQIFINFPFTTRPSPAIEAGIIPETLDISLDAVGDFTGTVTADTISLLSDSVVVYMDGAAKLVPQSYAEANGLLDTITYDVTQYDVPFTRQLNSYYVDWTQHELPTVIDGSITNVINGATEATGTAIAAPSTATEFVLQAITIGDIATTALGAVNTGDITVGVNSAVEEAGTSTARAIQASMDVVGGSEDTGTMMLNIAHNTSIIQGNVDNNLTYLNGSVGETSTTALGAVNTGTIVSGVEAVVQGIVGMSGQTSF